MQNVSATSPVYPFLPIMRAVYFTGMLAYFAENCPLEFRSRFRPDREWHLLVEREEPEYPNAPVRHRAEMAHNGRVVWRMDLLGRYRNDRILRYFRKALTQAFVREDFVGGRGLGFISFKAAGLIYRNTPGASIPDWGDILHVSGEERILDVASAVDRKAVTIIPNADHQPYLTHASDPYENVMDVVGRFRYGSYIVDLEFFEAACKTA
jgi:hypothetical protein